jgi:hypothetical protein
MGELSKPSEQKQIPPLRRAMKKQGMTNKSAG